MCLYVCASACMSVIGVSQKQITEETSNLVSLYIGTMIPNIGTFDTFVSYVDAT